MRDEQLEAFAQRIRDLWVAEYRDFELRTKGKATGWGSRRMSKWDGGETEDGRIHKPVWPKIAVFCLEHGLEPDVLIHALFYRKVDYPPMPNQAHGGHALEKYNEYTAPGTRMEIKTELLHAFESQKQRVLADVFSKVQYYKLDEKAAWRITVASKDTPLTPLFRYCVARNQGWEEVATQYEPSATRQYRRFADVYDEVWGDWVPTDFKQKARGK
jgi:hypothetical protein